MNLCFRVLISFILLFTLGACSQNTEDFIDDWEDDGWTYVATHGTKGGVKRTGKLQSEKPSQWKQLGWKEESEKPNSTNKVTTFMQCFALSKTMTMNSSLL